MNERIITIASPEFNQLWGLYSKDMMAHAYAGGAAAVTLANMYDVNLTIWLTLETFSS